ncbi:MAG: phosphodiester glycosidase family protein [Thermaceae bacterium]
MKPWPLLLIWTLLPALAQAYPAEVFGLSFREEEGAWVYEGNGIRLVYSPGMGWIGANPDLPAPQKELLPLKTLIALGYFQTPEAGVRFRRDKGYLRLVLDLPAPSGETVKEGGPLGEFSLLLPYFLPGLLEVDLPLKVRLLPEGTELSFPPLPGVRYRYRLFPLKEPDRLVLDLYMLLPESTEPLAKEVRYREVYGFSPEPIRLYLVEAERGRLLPVGTPGRRALGKELAPGALAVLNGGYFDGKTGTPIGLWIQDGVTISYPYGRVALLWNEWDFFLGLPRYEAVVQNESHSLRVGLNLQPGRYTAYTLPGPVGRRGEEVALVQEDRVQTLCQAPCTLPPGAWALAYPQGNPPFPLGPGERLSLYGRLEPPFRFGLEGGPLLVQEGRYAFFPQRENFKDRRPLEAKTHQAGVALFRDGRLWLFASEPTTPALLARALEGLGVWQALRMDGGGSVQLWVKGRLRYGAEPLRPIVSALALFEP